MWVAAHHPFWRVPLRQDCHPFLAPRSRIHDARALCTTRSLAFWGRVTIIATLSRHRGLKSLRDVKGHGLFHHLALPNSYEAKLPRHCLQWCRFFHQKLESCTFCGVPIIRIIALGCLHVGPHIYAKAMYHFSNRK